MRVALLSWWGQLTPTAQAWIKGCIWAMVTAMANTLVASPFTTWKGMLVIATSSACTGFKLYRAHSPFPREAWTREERAIAAVTGDKP